jgi:hypothetical protein
MVTGTTEELLSLILQQISPCPEVCNNEDPYGSGLYDIRTGLKLSPNGESILPTPPPTPPD